MFFYAEVIKNMATYNVGGFTFDSESEAKRAKQELQLIENLKAKTDINNPIIAKQLFDRCKATGKFKTKIGIDFLNKLQQTANNSIDNNISDKVYKKNLSASNRVYIKDTINKNINDNNDGIFSSKSLSIDEEYENTISEYINNGYKIVSQSNEHTELKKASIFKYIFWLLIIPNIGSLIAYYIGSKHPYDFSAYANDRFEYASLKIIGKFMMGSQMSVFVAVSLFIIGICILIATKGREKVFIRITKTGGLDITGNILKHNKDYFNPITSSSLLNIILIFVLPLLAIDILQQLFNYAGYGYLRTTLLVYKIGYHNVIRLIVTLFIGLSIGTNATISYYIGKNNIEKVKKAVHTSILLVIIISIIVTFISLIFSNQIAETLYKDFESAGSFFNICFLSIPFQAFYYCGAAIMFIKGDTKKPLICILISGIINILLGRVFVEDLEMEFYGLAFAILISQIISAGLIIYFLVNEKGVLRLNLRNFSFDKKILINVDKEVLSKIFKIGIPIALQNIILWFSDIYIVKGMYLYSDSIYRSDSIEYTLYSIQQIGIFANIAISAFSIASVTFISQNYGANKLERCSKIIKYCLILGGLFTVLLSMLFFVFSNYRYIDNNWLITIILFEVFNLVIAVFSSSMYGYGYSFIPAVISVFGICGIRLLWIYSIYQNNPTLETLLAVYPISWIITAITTILAYFVIKRRIKSKVIN